MVQVNNGLFNCGQQPCKNFISSCQNVDLEFYQCYWCFDWRRNKARGSTIMRLTDQYFCLPENVILAEEPAKDTYYIHQDFTCIENENHGYNWDGADIHCGKAKGDSHMILVEKLYEKLRPKPKVGPIDCSGAFSCFKV